MGTLNAILLYNQPMARAVMIYKAIVPVAIACALVKILLDYLFAYFKANSKKAFEEAHDKAVNTFIGLILLLALPVIIYTALLAFQNTLQFGPYAGR